jgi:phosphoribosylamine--glycine ligase
MAAEGYPDAPRVGDVIHGIDEAALLPGKLFHAGTRFMDGEVVTSGGRVLCAVGVGGTVQAAHNQAYELVSAVRFRGAHYRRDIGFRAIAREG